MGDFVDNKLEERKEKIKSFLKGFDNKTLIYLIGYIILMLIAYFTFNDKIKIGNGFLFIVLPIISIILFLFKKPIWALLLNIIVFSFIIRIQNLDFLIDVTTNKYIPADPDAMAFLRYAQYINENGKIMSIDMLRYFPYGFNGLNEFSFLSNFIVYLYKFLSIFSSIFTLELVDIIYPPIAFAISLVFFFLLVKKLFNENIALLSTAFLAFIPSYLFRTLTGISDKEALATVFMFAALYFYVCSWKTEKLSKMILFGVLSGIMTATTNLIWGGGVFVFLLIGVFSLIEILLNRFSKKDFYGYLSWIVSSIGFLIIFFPERYSFGTILLSSTTAIAIFSVLFYFIDYLIFEKKVIGLKYFQEKIMPQKLFSFIFTALFGSLIVFILFGGNYFIAQIKQTIDVLVTPFATNRWVRTVAENSQVYITDWINNFGKYYLWIFIVGSIFLFYDMHKKLKYSLKITIVYALLIIGFIFSRYSSDSILNGKSFLSILIYMVSLIGIFLLFIIPYLHSHYKNKESSEEIKMIDKKYTFVLIFFFIMIIAGKSAARLIFIFSPITAILASYLFFRLVDLFKHLKLKIYEYGSYIVVGVICLLLLSNFAQTSLAQASSVGPTYNQQWQYMGKWMRDNTKENAVFAHWWDYGYLVQYNNRATISDGGNAGGYEVNYFTGRNVLTGQTETEALQYLKTKNVTNLLIVSDEIGKYPAYSSIGSDANYDRYSWITNFILDPQQTQETRNETLYLYRGGFPLDEDFVYEGKVYPRQSAGIGAIILPLTEVKDNNSVTGFNVGQPSVVLIFANQQTRIPLSCVYFNNQKYEFKSGLNGCFRVIPIFENGKVNPIGAGLYLSPKVKNSLFAELYLYNKQSENFKLVYNDDSQIPLAIYNGRLIGPYRVWEVNYPNDLKVPEYLYKRELPDERVTEIKEIY